MIKKCKKCNKPFETNNTRKVFCSQGCMSRFHGEASAIRLIKTKLATKTKCEICGYDEFPILQDHHVINRCNTGGDNDTNLIVVCPNCHKLLHNKIIIFKERRTIIC